MATAKCKLHSMLAGTESPLVEIRLITTKEELAGFKFYGMDDLELVQKEEDA